MKNKGNQNYNLTTECPHHNCNIDFHTGVYRLFFNKGANAGHFGFIVTGLYFAACCGGELNSLCAAWIQMGQWHKYHTDGVIGYHLTRNEK